MKRQLFSIIIATMLLVSISVPVFAQSELEEIIIDAEQKSIVEIIEDITLPMPKDIKHISENGTNIIMKTYSVSPDFDEENLVETPFIQNDVEYTKRDIVEVETKYTTETKLAAKNILVEHDKKDGVLAKFQPLIDYNENGYEGQLSLDAANIITEVAGYQSYNYTVSDTREYTGFDRNDTYGIPKTVNKDGTTLTLANVEWVSNGSASVDGIAVSSVYTAVVEYSGNAVGSAATGYISTGIYMGEVEKSVIDSITYAILYEGEEIPTPPIPPNYLPFIFLFVLAGGAGLAMLAWKYRKNAKIYIFNEDKYFLVSKYRIEYSNPVLDLSDVEHSSSSNDYYIVVDRFAAKRLSGRDVKVIRKGLKTFLHKIENTQNEYEFQVTYEPISEEKGDAEQVTE